MKESKLKFAESKFYKKHKEIIESFTGVAITPYLATILENKITEFIDELRVLGLYTYMNPSHDFNDLDWFIHDCITCIYRGYSTMYNQCLDAIESTNYHKRSELALQRLITAGG